MSRHRKWDDPAPCYCEKCGFIGELSEDHRMWPHDGCTYSAVPLSSWVREQKLLDRIFALELHAQTMAQRSQNMLNSGLDVDWRWEQGRLGAYEDMAKQARAALAGGGDA